jgi:hypothetical protein
MQSSGRMRALIIATSLIQLANGFFGTFISAILTLTKQDDLATIAPSQMEQFRCQQNSTIRPFKTTI